MTPLPRTPDGCIDFEAAKLVLALEALPVQTLEALRTLPTAPEPPPSQFVELPEACALSGLSRHTLRNLLHARDAGLIAAKLPGKAYRFHRERFLQWVESRADYARLPGIRRQRKKQQLDKDNSA